MAYPNDFVAGVVIFDVSNYLVLKVKGNTLYSANVPDNRIDSIIYKPFIISYVIRYTEKLLYFSVLQFKYFLWFVHPFYSPKYCPNGK